MALRFCVGKMTYNDDEPIVESSNVSGGKSAAFIVGNTKLTVINKSQAPLEETDFKVLVELTGPEYAEDRIPVDFVTVLDVSRSMNEEDKIGKLKTAMQFLVKKLSLIDRLSVVTFSWSSRRLFPLRQITDESREDIIKKVNALKAGGLTNTAAGLKMALEVLNDRRLKDGRVGVIMLMSDGEQTLQFGNARRVDHIDKFPVHTFSLGEDSQPKVLQEIAERSNGGTYSDVGSGNHLSIAFSQCLAGLMISVIVQDLKLTITPDGESEIKAVSAGNYPQIMNDDGSITISLGDLHSKEVLKVLVDLVLPAVERRHASDVLQVTYTYSVGKEKRPFVAPSIFVTITRTDTAVDKEREKAILEEKRLKTANMVKEARALAYNELEEAKDKVVEAQNSLEGAQINEPYNELIEKLKHELQQLLDLMRTQKLYEQKGPSDAMYFEASHDRQRYGASGDRAEMRSFGTPRMNAYHEQAKESEDGVEEECIAEEEREESLSEEECLTEEEGIAEEESEEHIAEEESEEHLSEDEHIAEEESEEHCAEEEHIAEEESEERTAEEESEDRIAEEESEDRIAEKEHPEEEESEQRIAEEESEEHIAEEESEKHLSEEEHIAEEESTEHLSKEERNAEKERMGKEKRIAEKESEEHQERIPTIPKNAYLKQAKEFEKDPTKPPPSAEDDETKEILDDPTIPYYIKLANLLSKSAGRAIKSSIPRT